jgi:thiamine biosynthesis protein ThiI
MLRSTHYLASTNEVSLKGGNRGWFEHHITQNVGRALKGLPDPRVTRPAWRVLIRFAEPVDETEVARRLATVFGLSGFMAARPVGRTMEEAIAALPSVLEGRSPADFAVRCQRSDKSLPFSSVDVERRLGQAVVDLTGWPVRLKDPEFTLHVLVDRNGFFFWTDRIAGPGGLPSGTGGQAACLLSGGIDSPVAAWMAMKRGLQLDFIHFHSVPRTDPASLEKVVDLARVLARYQHRTRLHTVPLLPIQEQIVSRCREKHRVLLYRRFMFRLAERVVADRTKASALVTGESLGQVASQTIENLGAVEQVTSMPVLRPLIGMDKLEITGIARRAGTYETSIRPHFDCCSFLVPDHPATRATAENLEHEEAELDVEALVADAAAGCRTTTIHDPVDWAEMPVPAELTRP